MSGVEPSGQNLANVQFVKREQKGAKVKVPRTYTRLLPGLDDANLRTNINPSVRALKDIGKTVLQKSIEMQRASLASE